MYDLDTTAFPYSTWCASHDGMMAYFAAKKPTIETNTVYVGSDFDFGFTGWCGTCALPGKYGEYGADDFAALFTGYIEVPETGTYRFRILSDDGVALYIGRKFACGTTGEASGTYDGSIALEAGLHEIALAFHERGERQGLQVNWQMPSAAALAVLPQSVLYHVVQKDGGGGGEDDPEEPEPVPGTGGLMAEFFDLGSEQSPYGAWCASYAEMTDWFSGLARTISTNTIYVGKTFDFGFTGWSGTCAFPGKYARPSAEDFAALFTGSIEVPETGTYHFRALSDDGIALYIGRKLACGTTGEATGTYDGSISLAAGVHDFVLAYHERGERQGLQIYWQRPSDGELGILPQSVLRTERTGEDEPAPPPERSGGLAASFFDLGSSESPCPIWCASREAMVDYFAGQSATLSTNTAYLGKRFDFGFTGWYGTCLFPGKYGDYAADNFAALFTGRILIEEAGIYQFQILSDDGTVLYIDGELACGATVDENGTYDGSIELAAGMHDIALAYREGRERQGLQVFWQPPSASAQVLLPQSVLYLPGEDEEAGTATPLDFSDGLVAYWPFDGDAKDASGNGNDGTVYGATSTADRNGKANGAYYFDGNDSIEVVDSASLRSPTNAISISAWVHPEVTNCVVICKGVNKRQYGLFWDAQNMYINDWCGESRVDVIFHNCPSLPMVGTWQHVVATWDGKTMKVYLNGTIIGEESASGVWAINSVNLFIGKDSPGATDYYLGYLDELAIWNRALTADEVARLAAGEKLVGVNGK